MSSIKETIKAKIEGLKKTLEESNYYLDNSQQALGYSFALDDFKEFIDSLPEDKPSEDLEEAAEERARKIYPYEGGTKGLICENSIPIYKAGFIAGAEWMREQMMKEAVEGEVWESEHGLRDIVLQTEPFQKVLKGLKEGDKVKIIIVKQDAARRK